MSKQREQNEAYQLLDYLALHLDAVVRFQASDMVLNILSNASYLSKPKACSQACGHFFMGSIPSDGKPIKLNGAFHMLCSILQCVAVSVAKADVGHYL